MLPCFLFSSVRRCCTVFFNWDIQRESSFLLPCDVLSAYLRLLYLRCEVWKVQKSFPSSSIARGCTEEEAGRAGRQVFPSSFNGALLEIISSSRGKESVEVLPSFPDRTLRPGRGGREGKSRPPIHFRARLGVFFHFRTAASSFGAFLSFSEDDLLSRARRVSLSAPRDGNGKSYYVKLASRRLHHRRHRRPGSHHAPAAARRRVLPHGVIDHVMLGSGTHIKNSLKRRTFPCGLGTL